MFDMNTTITTNARALNRETGGSVASSHDIRRAVGRAWLAIAASGEKIRQALSVHHSQVSYRKQGSGPIANAAIEIDALERAKIPTDPLTDVLERVKLAARGPVCMTTAIRAEAEADAEEDIAAAEYALGIPGSTERWAEALIRQANESRRAAQALLTEVAR